jgi:superfamily I DNA/RNA helicase
MFEQLTKVLAAGFGSGREPVYLIGNAMFDDKELDAVLLKGDALFVIEMKDYGGKLRISETTEWFANGVRVKGGSDNKNPYRQLRDNKFALLNYLKRNGPKILPPPEVSQYWHICGVVLFGRDIQFDEKMPQSISDWFTICDFRSLLKAIAPFRTRGRLLTGADLERMTGCLGLCQRHIYTGAVGATPPTPAPTTPVASAPRLRVLYYNQSHFRSALLALRQSGGRKTAAASRLLNLIEQAGKGIDSFATLAASPDARIENALIYMLNEEARFVAIKSHSTFHLCYCGTPAEVESWLQANDGLTLAVDGETLRIDSTVVTTEPTKVNLPPTQMTEDNQPFLARVKGLDLENLVPVELIKDSLLSLDENSSEQQIRKVLDAIADEDVRLFLHDVLSLARAGDITGAEARIRLRKGEACPVVDADGMTQQAISSDANPDQVTDLTELELKELERLFDQDFEKWMLHLHKDQEALAKADFDKPVVLTGVSGSGKTCILVHRARHLARQYKGERIGILTLNRSLANLLRNLVQRLCLEGEEKNIRVMAFYDYFSELLHEIGPGEYLHQLSLQAPPTSTLQKAITTVNSRWNRGAGGHSHPFALRLAREYDPRNKETTQDTWDEFYATQEPERRELLARVSSYLEESQYGIDASRYLHEEFTLVRSAFAVSERAARYAEFSRAGRTIPLQVKQRLDILRLLLYFEETMLDGALLDVIELTLAVTPLFRHIRELPPEKRFRCLLVDEFQDFSTLDLRLLMWVPPRDKQNALFLAGDPVQKILVKSLDLANAGLGGRKRHIAEIRGPVASEDNAIHLAIKKNYRNSRQILRAASKLANVYGQLARNAGEDIEVLDPELAVRETAKPIALKTDRQVKKAWEIARQCLAEGQTQAWTICIATASTHQFTSDAVLAMRPPGLQAEALSGEYIKRPDTIVVSTLSDLKGFEFNLVLIVGCDEGVCPASNVAEGEVWRDALRFYVGMTRARDQVYMLYEGAPSPFVRQMEHLVVWTEEQLKQDYQPAPAPLQPKRMKTSYALAQKGLRPHDPCVMHLSADCLKLLRVFFDANIDEARKLDCRGYTPKAMDDLDRRRTEAFHRWVTPKNLSSLRASRFGPWRRLGPRALQKVDQEFRNLGINMFLKEE